MKKAFDKDIYRSIKKGKKRFVSIAVIAALGVTMLTGIRASCVDLRYSADAFFDAQNLYDISVLSTLGITDDDIEALAGVSGVGAAEGGYTKTVYTENNDKLYSAEMRSLSELGINQYQISQGKLPEKDNEIAVTEKFLTESGKAVGDSFLIKDEGEFIISGVILDTLDINSEHGAVAFRSTSATDYVFVATKAAMEDEVYTVAYLTLENTDDFLCYSEEYEQAVEEVVTAIEEEVKPVREEARYNEITLEAYEEIEEAKAEAEEELAEAWAELEDARIEIEDAKKELEKAVAELQDARDEADAQFAAAREEIRLGREEIQATMDLYGQGNPYLNQQLAALSGAEIQIAENEEEVYAKLEEAEAEILEAKEELAEGEEEYLEGLADYEEGKAEVEKEIADAIKEVEDIEFTQWYVQDRMSLGGYGNVKTDADCIESVGTVFPVVFLLVAVLISLTTVARMVEEDRGLIGTYKALGFTDGEIRKKYMIYAFWASFLGSIIGDVLGYVVLPEILFIVFRVMYSLPKYLFTFDFVYGIGGIVLFVVAISTATYFACRAELKNTPAALMRPKAPRAGARIFIEYIKPLWKRISFLNKVTARNLFRYKRRLFMTVAGIMGCTALLVCAFAVYDTVSELLPRQYETTYQYDLMAVAEDNEELLSCVKDDEAIRDYINVRLDTVKIINADGREEKVQLYVVPEGESIEPYIHLETMDNETISLKEGDVFVTVNASNVLGFDSEDVITLQDLTLKRAEVKVSGIVRNYLGNNVFMTQGTYETLFGEYEANALLAHFSEACENPVQYAEDLEGQEGILSASSMEEMQEEFTSAFFIINMVVYLIIFMAAGLAFTVLFTLSTTNISERERELATIKVLGFYDKEVHLYVNKETMILTGAGILLGLPVGAFLGSLLTGALNMPSIFFDTVIYPISYVYSGAMAFLFAIVVNIITDRFLNEIDPVEALKSIE